jgi:hypothetical protein
MCDAVRGRERLVVLVFRKTGPPGSPRSLQDCREARTCEAWMNNDRDGDGEAANCVGPVYERSEQCG